MKNVSVKLDDSLFSETEDILSKVMKNRNRYINEAVHFYNQVQRRILLTAQLSRESKLVSKESMKVLHEFEQLESGD